MEIKAEEVKLKDDRYFYTGKYTDDDGQEVEFICEWTCAELRKKGAPMLMPYAEMAMCLGRSTFRQLIREYG